MGCAPADSETKYSVKQPEQYSDEHTNANTNDYLESQQYSDHDIDLSSIVERLIVQCFSQVYRGRLLDSDDIVDLVMKMAQAISELTLNPNLDFLIDTFIKYKQLNIEHPLDQQIYQDIVSKQVNIALALAQQKYPDVSQSHFQRILTESLHSHENLLKIVEITIGEETSSPAYSDLVSCVQIVAYVLNLLNCVIVPNCLNTLFKTLYSKYNNQFTQTFEPKNALVNFDIDSCLLQFEEQIQTALDNLDIKSQLQNALVNKERINLNEEWSVFDFADLKELKRKLGIKHTHLLLLMAME
ncbi:Hypothetical_protein [Hexamita inflata]|uniref:Hypothetical_protein n=1 Tax=Hexamita inflata TaxID=28002 RepID=A0ABP1HA35_9EUKA